MRKRILLVALVGPAVVLTVAVATWPREHTPSPVTLENFRRIKEGMTKAEARAILGPPGDYRSAETISANPASPGSDPIVWDNSTAHDDPDFDRWLSDTAAVALNSDKSGRIVSAYFFPQQTVDHGALGNLVWQLKRQWHRWFPE